MAYQRGWNRLQSSPHWKPLEKFKNDPMRLELGFGTDVNSTGREDIRQICKHMGLNFRCVGDGTQKRIMALKLDIIRERKRAEELALDAPRAVAGFYRGALNALPETEKYRINALFVQFYGGDRAWSLGEAYAPEALQAEEEERREKRRKTGEEPESSDEDVEEMLGLIEQSGTATRQRWTVKKKSGERFALAARGWTIMPWEESAQMHEDKEVPMSGPKDAAFRHYSGPVGKPTYELKWKKEDSKLAKERPAKYQGKDPNCQVCYSFQRYVELWGSSKCTNSLPFEYSDLLLQRYHPKLQTSEPCHPDIGSLCEPGKLHPRYSTTGTTSRPGSEASQPPSTTGTGLAPSSAPGSIYGFYLHVFQSPAAVIYQVRKLKEVFPGSPIHIMSDGGADFGPLCQQEGCTFSMCPPANDRWHPWPFFRRLYDAAVSLKTEFVIMLEPDNTIHGPIKKRPQFDAGGVLVRDRSFAGADYVEKLAKKRVSGYKWTKKNQQAGLCGGSYYKREAILDALSDERVAEIDWNMLGERFTKEIYSSDFALQYALAARGWTIMPWEEAAQMHNSKEIPMAGPKDATFRHYSGPVGKPTYELKMRKEDNHLVKDQPAKFRGKDSNCQLCYNLTRYKAMYGSSQCTNEIPFTFSKVLMDRYHPELKTRKCDLPWLCEPGKKLGT
ncbi:Peptidyl-prolyl cis-trans isomerase A [Durusdinium trenchii]|uniref:Peptidyl-prolyl cis-trans isomerase A n=1 Tax=Durusdinium trenchii TaxID=1381693 RepID=A0ABP0NVU3_9DINO